METPSAGYPQRTKWNVRDSEGTVVFTLAQGVGGGSKKTLDHALELGKPVLHVHLGMADVSTKLVLLGSTWD